MGRPSPAHYDQLFLTKLKSVCIHVLDQLNANNEIKEAFDLCHDISRRDRSIHSFLDQPNIYSGPPSHTSPETRTYSSARRRLGRASGLAQQDSDHDDPLSSLPEPGPSTYAFPSLVNPDYTFEQLADHLDPDDKFIKRICEILIKETAKQARVKKAETELKACDSALDDPIVLSSPTSDSTTSFARRSFHALTQPYLDESRHRTADPQEDSVSELIAQSDRLTARMYRLNSQLGSSSEGMRLPSLTGIDNVASLTQEDGNSSSNESLSARSRAHTLRGLNRLTDEMVSNAPTRTSRRRLLRDTAPETIRAPLPTGVSRWFRVYTRDSAAQSSARLETPHPAEEEVDPDVSLTRATSLTRRNAIRTMPGNSPSSRSLASNSSRRRNRAQEEEDSVDASMEVGLHTSPPPATQLRIPAASPDGRFAMPERPRSRSFTFVTTPAAVLRRSGPTGRRRLESGLDPTERLPVLVGDDRQRRMLSHADSDAELDLDLGLALDEEAGSGASTPLEARRATFEAYARRRRLEGREDEDQDTDRRG